MSRNGWIALLLSCLTALSAAAQDRGVVVSRDESELLAVPAAERERVGFDAGASTALFVGVRDFDDPALTSVPFAVDDAVDLAHLFTSELKLVTPGRVVLALSGEPAKDRSKAWLAELKGAGADVVLATQAKILSHLLGQSKAAGADGLFLVGLATHGFTKAGQDYLFARDTLLAYPEVTGIPVPLLLERLADASTPRRFALLDACKERLGAARGAGEASPMGKAFHDAIAAARGQVVLAATTTNGYAYDDVEHKNGVFTAAILDGLRGAALEKGSPFVTAGTLADYVNRRVRQWIHQHRPDDHHSQGITRNVEGAGAALPLAADPKAVERLREYQTRKLKAIDKLRDHLGGPLTGQLYDTAVAFLNVETPTDAHLELLQEVEALDDTRRAKRRLAAYVEKYVSPLAYGAKAPSAPEPQPGPPDGRPRIPVPPPETARLTVRSNVRGDTVYLDGQARGPTGPRAHELSSGTHTVRVEKADYAPWERTLVLAAGARETVRAELVREPVSVSASVVEPELARIRGGCFEMGSPEKEEGRDTDERQHRVCVEDFELGRREVTVAAFRAFVEANGYRTEAERGEGCRYYFGEWKWDASKSWRSPGFEQGETHPVVCVSWNDAEAYIAWLNGRTAGGYRLPTEAEWEYAARGGKETARYSRYWGNDPDGDQACDYANVGDGQYWSGEAFKCWDGYRYTAPAGQKRPNGYGLYDMLGNVWEWTCSAYEADYGGEEKRCAADEGARRVLRGGSWDYGPRYVRAAYRLGSRPGNRGSTLGFRLARTP